MPAAVERARMRGAVPLAATGGVTAAAIFFGGGSGVETLPWVGSAAVLLACAAVALGMRLPRPEGAGLALVALLAGLAALAGLSLLWSIAPDRSWEQTNRALVYVAFLALGLLAARPRPVAALLAALAGAALAWGLAGKAIPALFPDGARAPRLREPVGYWNGLALLADLALPLALWAVTRARTAVLRGAGAALAYAAVVAVLLTSSRAGVAGAVVAVLLWLALSRERVAGAVAALLAAAPAAAVAGWAFTRPALVEAGATSGERESDGAWFALLLVAGGAAAVGLVIAALRRPLPAGLGRPLALAGAAGLAAAAVAVAVAADPLAEFRGEAEDPNTPGRLTSLSSNNRWQWWNEAWDVFAAQPAGGTGAGTFELARRQVRVDATSVSEPHSLPLQLLADLGLAGLLLGAGAVGTGGVAVARALRRLPPDERAAGAALAVAPAVYVLHALVDYPADFLAVTAPVLVATGALVGAARPAERAGVPWRAAAGLAGLAVVVSLAAPALAGRSVDRAFRALERGDVAAAEAAVDRARDLDPLSVEPLYARAAVAVSRGRPRAALEAYADAVRLQPENPETWYALGVFELQALGDACNAYDHLNRAYTLDPKATHWVEGGPLDRARDVRNSGVCG